MRFNELMKAKTWSPWLAGALLGVIAVASYLLVGKTIGSSGGIESIDSLLASALHLSWADSMYFKYQMPPVISFQVVLFIGMLLGSFTASKLSKEFKFRMIPDKQWTQTFGPSKAKRWIMIFIGGIILEFSAGIAGGCTSGLAISGTMQLSPAGLIFIAALFIAGIITTKLLYGRGY